MTKAHIDRTVQHAREALVPESSRLPSKLSPAAHCEPNHPARRSPRVATEEEDEDEGLEDTEDPFEYAHETELHTHSQRSRQRSRKRPRESEHEESSNSENSTHDGIVPLLRPSEYLRSRCALCFGGRKW